MKTIIQAMLEEIYTKADELAKKKNQTAEADGKWYITLYQLEQILKEFEG